MMKSIINLITQENEWLGYLQIILACSIWGTYGLFVKVLPYPPEVIVFFRFLFSGLALVIFASLSGNLSKLKPSSSWKRMVLIGAFNTFSWIALTKSIAYTSVANGFILYYTAPCFVVMLAPIFLKERIEKKSLIALVPCFVGIVSVMGYSEFTAGDYHWQGNILALISGILYAATIMGLKSLPDQCLGLVSNVYMSTVIALVSFPLALPYLHTVSLPGMLTLLLLGITIQAFASTIYMTGLRKVKAQYGSIISYSEILFAVFFAALFLHERVTVNVAIGGILIVAGGLLIMSRTGNEHKPLIDVPPTPEEHSSH